MFGIKKRIQTRQLRRAVAVENWVKAGMFDHQIAVNGYDSGEHPPSDHEIAIYAGAINYILAWDIETQLKLLGGSADNAETIRNHAQELLDSDPDLEKLVIRLLYEIASLAKVLEKDEWANQYLRNHPRIMEVLFRAREGHPGLFRDIDESQFEALFAQFVARYLPAETGIVSEMFK